jgi:type I restriction enzyme S subunit
VSAVLTAQEPSAKYLVNLQPPLVRHFDLIAQAPGGVARLRELILTLAVQGKLVPQDPSDEPASELLKKIRAEKDRLIAEGKIKRGTPLAEIGDDEKPFELPATWLWCKGREVFNVIRGVTYQKTDARETFVEDHLPLLRANNIQATINLDDLVYVPRQLVSDDQRLRKGDYLVCLASGSKKLVGKAAPFTSDLACSFGAFCGVIRPVSELDFLSIYLSSPLYRDTVSAASAGIGINNLKGTSLLGLDIPLPPMAEQSRIVTRVKELMQVCDALEASGQLEAHQHAQLVNTLLGSLTQSETPEVLAENWQRIATHFDVLLDHPEAVDALEQTILQLAVRGLLVPQDPTDEPASVLLQKIRTEKDHLFAQGKIKRDKSLPPITDEAKPFELPQGWEWVRMGSVVNASEAGWSPTCIGSPRTAGKWGVLKVSAVSWGEFDAMANKELPADLVPRPEYEVMDGDFLLSRANTAELVARSVVVKKAEPRLMLSDKIIRLDISRQMSRDFLNLCNNAEHARNHYATNASGTSSSMKNVSREVVLATPIPIPPMAEQFRIVGRVNELRLLCIDLRQRLDCQLKVQMNLSSSLLFD